MSSNEKYYRIGGLVWALSGPEFSESERLSIFACKAEEPELRVDVSVVEQPEQPTLPLIHREVYTGHFAGEGKRGRVVYLENDGRIIFSELETRLGYRLTDYARFALPYYGSKMVLRVLDMSRQVLDFGGVFLHASYMAVNGKAILFTAPKQTGKSTQAELWRRHRGAEVVNGDRALLRKVNGLWHAFGSPYCGTSDICHNVTCPLSAIVILGQAEENIVRSARPREALSALLNGFTYDTWNRTQMHQALTLAEEVIRDVPILKMDCLPDESAVASLEEVLWRVT